MQLHEDSEIFSQLIQASAQTIGLPQVYVEKDYWITKSLLQLSKSESVNKVIFKGGTSLSKAHKLINRFSEDIDLVVLNNTGGDSGRKKLIKDVETILTKGLEYIPNDERESKGSKFRRTVYHYPKAIKNIDFGQASPELLLEINSFTNPEPYEKIELQSLISEVLVQENRHDLIIKFSLEKFSINVLNVERTLVEKIIRVIKDSYSNNPEETLSKNIRHLYDICLILNQDKYRNLVKSNIFNQLLIKCIADEKGMSLETITYLDQPLIDAPLFSNFQTWVTSLNQAYNNFSNFVYGKLPTINDIEKSFLFIKENLR